MSVEQLSKLIDLIVAQSLFENPNLGAYFLKRIYSQFYRHYSPLSSEFFKPLIS